MRDGDSRWCCAQTGERFSESGGLLAMTEPLYSFRALSSLLTVVGREPETGRATRSLSLVIASIVTVVGVAMDISNSRALNC
jgi:hypothetical protein